MTPIVAIFFIFFIPDSGSLYTCGDGSFGQLGHGDYRSYSSPAKVLFFDSKHVEKIACGMRHSLVLSKGKQMRCCLLITWTCSVNVGHGHKLLFKGLRRKSESLAHPNVQIFNSFEKDYDILFLFFECMQSYLTHCLLDNFDRPWICLVSTIWPPHILVFVIIVK